MGDHPVMVALTQAAPIRIFFSYASSDRSFVDELETHLALMKRQGLIESSHGGNIEAGLLEREACARLLVQADIILLLVSAHFISSDNCFEIDLQEALHRHGQGTAVVIPIVLSPVDLTGAPFEHIKHLPAGRPLTQWADRNAAWLEIALYVRQVVASLKGRGAGAPAPPASTVDAAGGDIFFAYNSRDRPLIREIASALRRYGVRPWLDDQIPPGTFFQDALQRALVSCRSIGILVGQHGLGRWQMLEQRAALSQCINNGKPVIPVLLPGTTEVPPDLLFLGELQWVRFESVDDKDALQQLISGIPTVAP